MRFEDGAGNMVATPGVALGALGVGSEKKFQVNPASGYLPKETFVACAPK